MEQASATGKNHGLHRINKLPVILIYQPPPETFTQFFCIFCSCESQPSNPCKKDVFIYPHCRCLAERSPKAKIRSQTYLRQAELRYAQSLLNSRNRPQLTQLLLASLNYASPHIVVNVHPNFATSHPTAATLQPTKLIISLCWLRLT